MKEEQSTMPNQQDNRGKPQGGQNQGGKPGMGGQDDRRPQSNTPGQGKKPQPGGDRPRTTDDDDDT